MRVREYLGLLGRRRWIVALVIAAAVIVAWIGSYLVTPVYSASSLVRLAQLQDSPATYYTINYTERVANTAVHLLTSRATLVRVIDRLGLYMTPEELAPSIRVDTLANTELLRITAESDDPIMAAALANTLAALLIESGQGAYAGEGQGAEGVMREQLGAAEEALRAERARLEALAASGAADSDSAAYQSLALSVRLHENTVATLQAALTNASLRAAMLADSISIIDEASPPTDPVRPRPMVNLALGLALGTVGGVGLAFLVDTLDRRVLSSEGLAAAAGRVPVIGAVPEVALPGRSRRDAVLLDGERGAAAGEAVRMVRSVLTTGAMGCIPGTLLVTSAEPRAGKSTLLASLGVALARAGRSVIVVDSDLRRPTLHRVFGVANDAGFSNTVMVPESVHSTLRPTRIPGLRVLTSGSLLASPADLLCSPNVAVVLRELAIAADVVLLDSPPILAATDAITLAPLVGGVLLVAAQARVTDKEVRRALEQLQSVGATVLGLVLNRASAGDGTYGEYRSAVAQRSARPRRPRASAGRMSVPQAKGPVGGAKRQ